MLRLWPLRDMVVIGTGFILSILAPAQSGFLPPLVATLLFAFLSIRAENASILDLLCYTVDFLFLKQQYYEWGEAVEQKTETGAAPAANRTAARGHQPAHQP